MSKATDKQKALRDKAVEEFVNEIDPEKAESKITHWFGSSVNNDNGADKEDVNYFLALVKFLKRMRNKK